MNHTSLHLREFVFFCVLISLVIASCSLLGEDDREAKTTRWVTATAVYDEVNQNGAPVQRIALIDFDDPSNFRILARDSVTFGERPRFSPDKQRIIFENRVTPVSAGGHLTLPRSPGGWRDFRVMVLDIETGEINELVDPGIIDGASGLRYPDF